MTGSDLSSDAAGAALARLSDSQLETLALVAQYKSSKQIARILGISPNTVDQRLKRVQAILGVSSRFEAARLYAAAGGTGGLTLCGDLVYQTPELAVGDIGVTRASSTGLEDRPVGGSLRLEQPQAVLASGFHQWDAPRPWFSALLEAERKNELSLVARVAAIGGITLVSVLALAAAVSLTEGLSRIF